MYYTYNCVLHIFSDSAVRYTVIDYSTIGNDVARDTLLPLAEEGEDDWHTPTKATNIYLNYNTYNKET